MQLDNRLGGGTTYINAGTNVTITGAGTSLSPYVINANANVVRRKYTGSGSEGTTFSLPTMIGVALSKIIDIQRGGTGAGQILDGGVPVGRDIIFNTLTGNFTVATGADIVAFEEIFVIYLGTPDV